MSLPLIRKQLIRWHQQPSTECSERELWERHKSATLPNRGNRLTDSSNQATSHPLLAKVTLQCPFHLVLFSAIIHKTIRRLKSYQSKATRTAHTTVHKFIYYFPQSLVSPAESVKGHLVLSLGSFYSPSNKGDFDWEKWGGRENKHVAENSFVMLQ